LRGTDNAKSPVDEALAEARAKILTLTAEPAQASSTHHRNTAAIMGGVAGRGDSPTSCSSASLHFSLSVDAMFNESKLEKRRL
jgi:hypothetical protein